MTSKSSDDLLKADFCKYMQSKIYKVTTNQKCVHKCVHSNELIYLQLNLLSSWSDAAPFASDVTKYIDMTNDKGLV